MLSFSVEGILVVHRRIHFNLEIGVIIRAFIATVVILAFLFELMMVEYRGLHAAINILFVTYLMKVGTSIIPSVFLHRLDNLICRDLFTSQLFLVSRPLFIF